jgi:hypothetical protein
VLNSVTSLAGATSPCCTPRLVSALPDAMTMFLPYQDRL